MGPSIIKGYLHAPFFIFFGREPQLTDEQILAHFALATHQRRDPLPPSCTYAVIADLGDWTMLADDWLYQLWHLPTTRPAIESLGKGRPVFAWSIGDIDDSFEFSLYQDGKLTRHYSVDHNQVVNIDVGERLLYETELLASDLGLDTKMWRLTENAGIDIAVKLDRIRIYSKPYQSRLDPAAAIRNF